MYFDTPRDFIGGVYEQLLYGDQPLGWDIIGRKETVRGATRETFMGYLDHWYRPSRMVLGVGRPHRRRRARARAGAARRPRAGRDRRAGGGAAARERPRVKVFTKQSDQAHIVLGVPSYPLEHPDRYALQLLATVLGGGMSSRLFTRGARAARARLLRLRAQPQLHRRGLALRAGRRRHRADRRGGLDDRRRAAADRRRSRCPADELEKARNFAKGRFVLQLESPQGLIMFGLRKEVLERQRPRARRGARRDRRGDRRGRPAASRTT